jgi:hypothetical protein
LSHFQQKGETTMLKKLFYIFLCTTLPGVTWAGGSASVMTKAMDAVIISGANADFSYSRSLPYTSKDMVLFENVIVQNNHYTVIMQLLGNNTFKPVSASKLRIVEIPFRSIVIDGNDADWSGISPVVEDPAGDKDPMYSTVPGTDLANVYMARDDTYLYFMMTMHDGGPLQDPPTLYVVELQQYLNQIHTPGDLIASVSYTPDAGWTVSIGVRGPGGQVALYPSDYVGIGTGMLEWKVPIAAMQYPPNTPNPYFSPVQPSPGIENQFIRAYIHPGPHPNPSPVSDANDALTRPMIVNFY